MEGSWKGQENIRDKSSWFDTAFAGLGDIGGGAHVESLGDPGQRDGGLRVERGGDFGFARVAFLEAGKLRGTQLGEAQTFLEKPLGRTRFGSGVSTTK